ncbi:S8 family peptidase [Candidatus Woesebacteria bacterium]|nr:S8 family peptidase [Candidatus Woesebacteria bacterium]
MLKRSLAILFVFGLLVILLGTLASSPRAANPPQRLIITFEQTVAVNDKAVVEAIGARVIKELPLVNGLVVLIPDPAMAPLLKTLKGVKRVELDAKVFALKPPGGCDPWPECNKEGEEPLLQTLEWGVNRIDADLSWGVSRGTDVKVAIIDSGIDMDHPDLIANLQGGINFVSKGAVWNPADPTKWNDDNGHGTHVAGIVAAVDNNIGVIGVAPEAHLWAVKVLDRKGGGYVSDVIAGIKWSKDNGMQVINMSLGTSSDIQSLHDAVDTAYNAGIVIVAAAGNSGDGNGTTNEVIYPAKYSTVIAVAATRSDDSTPYWSAEGEEVEIAAPGASIRSTWKGGGYDTISGTSMASPHAAGTVALLLNTTIPASYDTNIVNGMWDPVEVRAVLIQTADDLGTSGFDNFYGWGLIDAEEIITGTQTP